MDWLRSVGKTIILKLDKLDGTTDKGLGACTLSVATTITGVVVSRDLVRISVSPVELRGGDAAELFDGIVASCNAYKVIVGIDVIPEDNRVATLTIKGEDNHVVRLTIKGRAPQFNLETT